MRTCFGYLANQKPDAHLCADVYTSVDDVDILKRILVILSMPFSQGKYFQYLVDGMHLW